MITLHGVGISDGISIGQIHYFEKENIDVVKNEVDNVDMEIARLKNAIDKTIETFNSLSMDARSGNNDSDSSADIFSAEAMLASDPEFFEYMKRIIIKQKCNAEYAVNCAAAYFSDVLLKTDDIYVNARARDINDVVSMLNGNLLNISCTEDVSNKCDTSETVILAKDMSIVDFFKLEKHGIGGIVLCADVLGSHLAILAQSKRIPLVCNINIQDAHCYDGKYICINGTDGEIVLDPDEKKRLEYFRKRSLETNNSNMQSSPCYEDDITADGRKLSLYCNISSVEEIDEVMRNGGAGVGLFRSEFQYLALSYYPDEELLFGTYRKLAAGMNGKRVCIRTFDVGFDKIPEYMKEEFNIDNQDNRGADFYLVHSDIFRRQIRAILRASAYGQLEIMFPMIFSVDDFEKLKNVCSQEMFKLDEDGINYDRNVKIGTMVETLDAVNCVDELAQVSDFLSIGTNDLRRFVTGKFNDYSEDKIKTIIINMISKVVFEAHKSDIRVSICGEMASDTQMLKAFLDLKVDELSVMPRHVPEIRKMIRNFN